MRVGDRVTIGREVIYVDPLKSELWMAHLWGDFGGSDFDNWEWFSLRLDTNHEPARRIIVAPARPSSLRSATECELQ